MKNLTLLFFLMTLATLTFGAQLMKRHSNLSDVDREFDEIYQNQVEIINADRAPSSNDMARVGAFWIWRSSTSYPVYVRFPDPGGWRRVVTTTP